MAYIEAAKVSMVNGYELVLTTVNAPYSKQLGAQELAHCLLDPAAAKCSGLFDYALTSCRWKAT
jgi:hypothetical protein